MNSAMYQNLQQNLHNSIIMTPSLKQGIQLLSLSSQELNDNLLEVVDTNPLLELEYAENSYLNFGSASLDDEYDLLTNHSESMDLKSTLLAQIQLQLDKNSDLAIAEILIDQIQEDGYFAKSRSEIFEVLRCYNFSDLEIDKIIRLIRACDPVGVGAWDLKDCLLLQVVSSREASEFTKYHAKRILNLGLEIIAEKRYIEISELLGLDVFHVDSCCNFISRLNPKPGFLLSPIHANDFVQPDITVRYNYEQGWQVILNDELYPKLKISKDVVDSLDKKDSMTQEYILQAKTYIKGINTREKILLKVVKSILKLQRDFFEKGVGYLQPMNLKACAELAGVHESTVSRLSRKKFIATPFGVFDLKSLFSSTCMSNSGDACSASVIKDIIMKIVRDENVRKPLSDQKICDMLRDRGYQVARRTVHKYRIGLNIPSAKDRKLK